jgi:hypothetical protein
MFVVFLVLYILVYYPPCTVLRVYIYIRYIYVCNCAYDIDDDDAEDRQKRVVYRPSYKKLGPTIDKEQTANSQKRTHTNRNTEYYYN